MSWNATNLVYVGSFVLHVGGGLALAAIKVRPPPEVTVVEIHDVARPPPKPPEPPPPEPVVEQEAKPRPSAPVPTAAPVAAAPDFGLVMSSGVGGPGGMAVPVAAPAPAPKQVAKKLAPKPEAGGCADGEETKAKALSMPRPAYTDEARGAAIEGKVRVELTIDEQGTVTNAAVLSGLGHGLDEAALAAVREAKFSPATRCGKGVPSTFVVSVRFAL